MNLPYHQGRIPEWLEQVWLERYLDRELTPSEEEWFEIYAIDKHHLVAEIENDNLLRDAIHAWARSEQPKAAEAVPVAHVAEVNDPAGVTTPASNAVRAQQSRRATPAFLSMAASMALAAGAGAGVVALMKDSASAPGSDSISSPRRVLIDAQRGGTESAPLVETGGTIDAPLLVDIAVPPRAENILARFADDSSLPLTLSSDGFVSLVGSQSTLRRLAPVRLVYQVGGNTIERTLDLSGALETGER